MEKSNALQTRISVAACKMTRWVLRKTGRGGTALPGKVAQFFSKDILTTVSHGMDVLVVTGTNGKTTTAKMMEHAFTSAGYDCLSNQSGANLLSGVTAELTCGADWTGRPKTHFAVIECDEGALKQVVPEVKPKVIVVTNFFRDQLDRYGEVTTTVNQIREGIQKVPEAILCLNADDSLVASLAEGVPNPVFWYGLDTPSGTGKDPQISDARYCIRCGSAYEYRYHTYAHLGDYYCPKCGIQRPKTDVAVTKIDRISSDGSNIVLRIGSREYEATVALPALYNIYNAVAAVCACTAFGLSAKELLASLSNVHSSFGRMENFKLGDKRVQMILVKNPAGCNEALSYVTSLDEDLNLVLGLNDRTADGHDISWIWDADYEQLAEDAHIQNIIVCGDRAQDMQLRLKYAGCDENRIVLENDKGKLLERMKEGTLPLYVLPNYTAMLELRTLLQQETGAKKFWE